MKETNRNKSNWNIQKLVCTGMLAAVAGALMSLEFSVPMMPPFYKIDFSDAPTIVALFMLGPVPAAFVEVIKIFIKLITVGTNTMYIGELANLLGIALFIMPIWIIYQKRGANRKAAVESLIAGVPIRVAFSCFCNACITLPLYAQAMGMSLDQVVSVVGSVNPAIHNLTTFIILATIPFNLIKLSLNFFVGYLLYERLKSAGIVPRLA